MAAPWTTFYYGELAVGEFPSPGPKKPGAYSYMAYRGPGHYEMGVALKSEPGVRCWLRQKDGSRLGFSVVGWREEKLVLADFSLE